MFDFYRVGCAVPRTSCSDVSFNTDRIAEKIKEAQDMKVRVLVFPELCITGYTCADLFMQNTLYKSVTDSLTYLLEMTKDVSCALFIGTPLMIGYQMYNAAVLMYRGVIHGIAVKTHIPNYGEFYEKRWFSSASELDVDEVRVKELLPLISEDYVVPVGNDLVFNVAGLRIAAEICEDAWAPITPSAFLAVGGAELICNLSASNDVIGKRDFRKQLIRGKSSELICGYMYASAGAEESTTDLIFSGQSIICANGKLVKENEKRVADNDYLMIADIDIGRIRADRLKLKTFKDTMTAYRDMKQIREVLINEEQDLTSDGALLTLRENPFVPSDEGERAARCNDIFDMQVAGLIKRLSVTGSKMVVGVSGGMDSTLTLLVCAKALKTLGLPMDNLTGITMPAFGTSDRTLNNSRKLMESLGINCLEIPIKDACIQHYKDIGHDIEVHDVTYENVQARERTQVLMDYANKHGAIVVGTGDLSELALGWCTYNGDQMSMYNVNGSIPKTLVRWLIDSVVRLDIFPSSNPYLRDILDTPISPELLPPDENGNISQKTEDAVGPYELHDFFLYYMMRYGFSPYKIFHLAKMAFSMTYDEETIIKWMKLFYRRFFTQQFKRSCMPDGVKVGSVALSPRGDWRMPSDPSAKLWLEEIEELGVLL